MKFLVTNDDGIDAPGLQALVAAALSVGEVFVLAPQDALSGCGHRVTTQGPLRLQHVEANRYALGGTPADCVRIGMHALGLQFDWILAGVNAGGNLGADVHHSGTVAAVREGALHGLPGIAFSQYRLRGREIDWDRVTQWTRRALTDILSSPFNPGTFWNINFPHLAAEAPDPETVSCPLDPSPLPVSYRQDGDALVYDGDYHGRLRCPGHDVDVCFRGNIALTRMSL